MKNIVMHLFLLVLAYSESVHAGSGQSKATDEEWAVVNKEKNAGLYPTLAIQGNWHPPARNADGSYHLFIFSDAVDYCKSQGLSLPNEADVNSRKEPFEFSLNSVQDFWGQGDTHPFAFHYTILIGNFGGGGSIGDFVVENPKDQKFAVICVGPKQSTESGSGPSRHSEQPKI